MKAKLWIKLGLIILASLSMFIVFGFFVDFSIVCFADLEMSDEVFETKLFIGCICIAVCLISYLSIMLLSFFEENKEKNNE